MDKFQKIGASGFDKATTFVPYEVHTHVKDNKPNFYNRQRGIYKAPLSKGDKISYLLQDVHLFHQNYDNLCKLDSTWGSEKGLEAFTIYYTNLTTLDDYIFPLTFKKEHIDILGDIEILEKKSSPICL